MPFRIIREDITRVQADAIVNTANPYPIIGGGTDRAIYEAAGDLRLLEERQRIGEIPVGEVAATPAYGLPAEFILHTVGPAWWGGTCGEYKALASCYRKSLLLAEQLRCKSIAFPLISTGVYGFPKDKALAIALKEISSFLEKSEMDVTLVVFGREAYELSSALVKDVEKYIDDRYVAVKSEVEYGPGGLDGERRRRGGYPEGAGQARENQRDSSGRFGGYWKGNSSDFPGRTRGRLRENLKQEYSFEDAESETDEGFSDRAEEAKASYISEAFLRDSEEAFAAKEPLEFQKAVEEDVASRQPSERVGEAFAQRSLKKVRRAFLGRKTEERAPLASAARKRSLSEIMEQVGESFQARLLRLIDERGLTDVEVYKKANIDRKLFSKIRCNPDYSPKKRTAVAFAIALELNLDETVDLLRRAGFALSPSSKFDLIVEYCIENRNYNIFEINALLFRYDQPLLGC